MANSNRKVLLIMDNFSAHSAAVTDLATTSPLQNTMVCYLPPNTTSKSQPLDQGIIRAFKAYYRRQWLQYMVDEFDSNSQPLKTMTLLKAVRWSIQAWITLTPQTIAHCWQHSTLLSPLPQSTEIAGQQADQLAGQLENELYSLMTTLQLQNRIQHVMAIDALLNPQEEQINDTQEEVEEQIASQWDLADLTDPEDEAELFIEPQIQPLEALYYLQRLQLYEEQQESGRHTFVEQLYRHKALILQRQELSRKQQSIAHYFQAI